MVQGMRTLPIDGQPERAAISVALIMLTPMMALVLL
jgi:hypothetical protein